MTVGLIENWGSSHNKLVVPDAYKQVHERVSGHFVKNCLSLDHVFDTFGRVFSVSYDKGFELLYKSDIGCKHA